MIPKTVLIASEAEVVQEHFRSAIEAAGHSVVAVGTADEVLTCLRDGTTHIDLVIADLRLPRGNGVEFIRAMREHDKGRVPIMVLSGTIRDVAEVRALALLDVSGYISEYSSEQQILPALVPHLFPDNFNRRTSSRVAIGVPVACRFGDTVVAALTLNVGKGGIGIRTMNPLEASAKIRVRFRLPSSKSDIEADCRVAWSDSRAGMGLEFERMEPASQWAIDEFVDQCFAVNRREEASN